jgi:hypothetical protein
MSASYDSKPDSAPVRLSPTCTQRRQRPATLAQLRQQRQERVVDQQHAGVAIVQRIRDLGRAPTGVDRVDDRTRPWHGHVRLDVAVAIGREDGHAVCRTHAQALQRARQPRDAVMELRERVASATADGGNLLRLAATARCRACVSCMAISSGCSAGWRCGHDPGEAPCCPEVIPKRCEAFRKPSRLDGSRRLHSLLPLSLSDPRSPSNLGISHVTPRQRSPASTYRRHCAPPRAGASLNESKGGRDEERSGGGRARCVPGRLRRRWRRRR